MALTRKLLKGMGLTDEQVDTIIEAHTDTVDGLKADISRYKADAEQLPGVQKELDAAKNELATGKKDSWKVKYDALKDDFETYKGEQEKRETHGAKEKAYRTLLKEAGISEKRLESVIKVSDIDGIELDDKGAIKDAKELLKSIKSEWADFIVTTSTKGADTATPPANAGGIKTREDIYKKDDKGRYVMSTAERQKALADLMASGNE